MTAFATALTWFALAVVVLLGVTAYVQLRNRDRD